MSTTFQVLAGINYIPTFEEILSLSNSYVNSFLQCIGIDNEPHRNDESNIYDNVLSLNAKWQDDYYAWFFLNVIAGATFSTKLNNIYQRKKSLSVEIVFNKLIV